jgi:hypothetical protein
MPDLDQIKQGEQAVSARCVCYIIPRRCAKRVPASPELNGGWARNRLRHVAWTGARRSPLCALGRTADRGEMRGLGL